MNHLLKSHLNECITNYSTCTCRLGYVVRMCVITLFIAGWQHTKNMSYSFVSVCILRPSKPTHANYSTDTTKQYNEMLYVGCDRGYKLINANSNNTTTTVIKCLNTGFFSSTPECDKKGKRFVLRTCIGQHSAFPTSMGKSTIDVFKKSAVKFSQLNVIVKKCHSKLMTECRCGVFKQETKNDTIRGNSMLTLCYFYNIPY